MGPLVGLRIVVTRAVHQAEELARPLRDLGAEVLLLPMIEIAPPADAQPLEQAAANCNLYDWIIFTSVNAVEAFASAMPADLVCKPKIATIGEATQEACEKHGLAVFLTPETYVAESLVAAFVGYDLHDSRVLIPSAAETRDVVPLELRKAGALVHVVEAYRNTLPAGAKTLAEEVFREPYPDWVLFASSSATRNLSDLLGVERLNRMRIATIGPVTTATARQLGLTVTIEASTYDVVGLIDAVCRTVAESSG